MIRIVRSDAKEYVDIPVNMSSHNRKDCEVYHKSDTVLIDKNWRPKDMPKLMDICPYECVHKRELQLYPKTEGDRCILCSFKSGFEAGFQACLEAMENLMQKEQGK